MLEIRLNKPKVNAIDHAMSRELGEAFRTLRDDPELRVGILTAEGGRIFSAGWDLKALDAGEARLDEWWADGDYGEGGFAGLTENWTLNEPVVVALNGLAVGGRLRAGHGRGSDHRRRTRGVRPSRDAAGHGAGCRRHPAAAAPAALQRRDGDAADGAPDGAEEAARYGLVNKVVPKHELMPTARAWAGRLAEAAPLALQTVKEVLRAIECRPLEDAFRIMRTGDLPAYRAMRGSEDAAEGVRRLRGKAQTRVQGALDSPCP